MRYYLDTSAVYHINTIPESILQESFYSVFGLLEIIAGLNEVEFDKRKAILRSAINSVAKCDYTFPERLIFEAFNDLKEYEFLEARTEDLFGIIDDIISSKSFAEFNTLILLRERKYDYYYFVKRDKFYTENFRNSTLNGNEMIASALRDETGDKSVKLANKEYHLSNRRAISNFLNEPLINSSFTILALANSAMSILGEYIGEITEGKLYNSYNGALDIFVDGLSGYSVNQIINNASPNRNDFQDLIHLLYLRNSDEIKMISNDGFFNKFIPKNIISVKGLSI